MSAAAPPNWRLNRETWAPLFNRLSWAHGGERAEAIMDGKDEAANADAASWHRLVDLSERKHLERHPRA